MGWTVTKENIWSISSISLSRSFFPLRTQEMFNNCWMKADWLLSYFMGASDANFKLRRLHIFSVKGQIGNIWGLMGHIVSVLTTELCCCSVRVAIDYTGTGTCSVAMKLDVQKRQHSPPESALRLPLDDPCSPSSSCFHSDQSPSQLFMLVARVIFFQGILRTC